VEAGVSALITRTWVEVLSANGVYQLVFQASAHPALVTMLRLSGLKEGKDLAASWPDFIIESRSVLFKWNSLVGCLQESPLLDSGVRLFQHLPVEAKWIPICKYILEAT
jgi:hypothetical protein